MCLLEKFKGKTGVDHHLMMVANKTISGLGTCWWMEKLIKVCQTEGRFEGPAFASADGRLASSPDYNAMFRRCLKMVQEETDLIPDDHNIDAFYSTFRMPRKTATTRIERSGFGNQFVDQMNRWRPQEEAQGWAAQRKNECSLRRCSVVNANYWDGFVCPLELGAGSSQPGGDWVDTYQYEPEAKLVEH
jgi:hypothetical protein